MSDSIIYYRSPASVWEEALPVGNGIMGAMVFGGAEEERLQLNEETMWTGWPYDNDSSETLEHLREMRELIFSGKYTEAQTLCEKYLRCRGNGSHGPDAAYGSYTTAGDLYILHQSVERGESYRRLLDMRNGEAVAEFSNGRSVVIASYRYNVIAVRLEGAAAGCSLRYERQGTDIAAEGRDIVFGGFLHRSTRAAPRVGWGRPRPRDFCLVIGEENLCALFMFFLNSQFSTKDIDRISI